MGLAGGLATNGGIPTDPQWKRIEGTGFTNLPGLTVATSPFLYYEGGSLLLNTANSVAAAFYLDPADFAGIHTPQLKVLGMVFANAVTAPAVNFTFGLYPVATWGGTTAAYPIVATLGAATVSTTINTPAAGSQTASSSSAVAFPAAGWFVLALVLSAQTAGGSHSQTRMRLFAQQV